MQNLNKQIEENKSLRTENKPKPNVKEWLIKIDCANQLTNWDETQKTGLGTPLKRKTPNVSR